MPAPMAILSLHLAGVADVALGCKDTVVIGRAVDVAVKLEITVVGVPEEICCKLTRVNRLVPSSQQLPLPL